MSTSCESLRGSIFFPDCAHFGHRWPNARFLKSNEVLTKEIAVSGDTTGPCCMPQGKNSYEEVLIVIIRRQSWLLPSMFNIRAIFLFIYYAIFRLCSCRWTEKLSSENNGKIPLDIFTKMFK